MGHQSFVNDDDCFAGGETASLTGSSSLKDTLEVGGRWLSVQQNTNSGCDSSDCTFCQLIALGPFCNTSKAEQYGHLLRRRLSQDSPGSWSPDCANSSGATSEDATSQNPCKRPRREQLHDDTGCVGSMESTETDFCPNSIARKAGKQCWRFESHWSTLAKPAPALLSEVLSFSPPSPPQRSDILCALEFSPDGGLVAAGGVLKQLRLYSLSGLSEPEDKPVILVRMPAKISSLAWAPEKDGVVTVGDYDGNVSQVHVTSGHFVAETDSHSGRKVWSVAHSRLRSNLVVSTSDDHTAKLWTGSCLSEEAATIKPPGDSSICGADFSATNENLLALASSNRNVYIYDMRKLQSPAMQLSHHTRPVSYVKFMGNNSVVSASTDGTLAQWDVGGSQQHAGVLTQPVKVFAGHRNEKNFVGLSVRSEDGLLACGSETAQVFSYHTSWSDPLATHLMTPSADPLGAEQPFVSAVCWQPQEASVGTGAPALLAAALQGGEVKLLTLTNPGRAFRSSRLAHCS